MINAERLSKRYGEKEILREISLSIRDGEIFGLIGPSGSGKSTLLRILDLIEMPTGGSLSILGEDALSRDARFHLRRRMGMLSQKPVIFARSVYDNIAIGMKYRKAGQAEIHDRVTRALRDIGLPDYGERPARTLSGGEAQRVALARAMVTDPEILFLDEPTANLDPHSVEKIEEIIMRLNRDAGTTVVVSTHDMLQGQRLSGRMGVIMDGRLPQIGNTVEIFHRPATKNIAQFVQVANILEGTVTTNQRGEVSVDVSGKILCAVSHLDPGTQVNIFFRAEDVTILLDVNPRTSARNIYAGKITRLMPSGPFVHVVIDCGIDITALVTIRSVEDLGLSPGKEVWVSVKATAIHVLPWEK
ncbi:MAG: ABC transporter ATP-binding protein [Methanomicrobiales archaeon]|nr:ABC transporter ATP-binding protein [Methanomicrobiales archaeon]